MTNFIETKKYLDNSFAMINEIEPDEFRIESFEREAEQNCLVIRGSNDFDTGFCVELKFHNVSYISVPVRMRYCAIKLAKPEDTMRIQQQILGGEVGWLICIAMDAEGGPAFEFFIFAERIEISTDQVNY